MLSGSLTTFVTRTDKDIRKCRHTGCQFEFRRWAYGFFQRENIVHTEVLQYRRMLSHEKPALFKFIEYQAIYEAVPLLKYNGTDMRHLATMW